MPGKLILISSPSGGGKNSVITALLAQFTNAAQFVTTTTRKPREGEKQGKDYFFRSREEFEALMKDGEFVETNEYAGNLYGTEQARLDEFLNTYDFVFSQADVHGKHSLDALAIPHLSIFLLPENLDVLKGRIVARGGVSEEHMQERMKIAGEELRTSTDYDHRIVNVEGKLDETVEDIVRVIREHVNDSV